MGLFLQKAVSSALDKGKLTSSYLITGACFLLIACNIGAFLFFPKIAAPLAIILSNVITIILMLFAFQPVNRLLQRSFEKSAQEYAEREKELLSLKDTVSTLENRNRELENRIDTWNQMATVPSNVNFTFKVETMTYDKSGYIVKEEPVERFLEDPAYKLSDKKGIFDKVGRWMDEVMHPGKKKVLYIGKFYAKASIGIDFTKIKYAVRDGSLALFGVRFSKLNDLAITPDEDDVNHCWLLNEDDLGIRINSSGLYKDFTDAYADIRAGESAAALEAEVETLCDNYTSVFRQKILERFPGTSFQDHIEDSSETWYSLKEHIQDPRVYPLASNMFLMADILSGSADIQPPALLP